MIPSVTTETTSRYDEVHKATPLRFESEKYQGGTSLFEALKNLFKKIFGRFR